ncbi:MAG: exonuclease domain-containing protein [Pikeienuella sp.]
MRIETWSLRLRVFLLFAGLGLGGAALVVAGLVLAGSRAGPEATEPLVLGGGIAVFGILLLTAWIWQLFDENMARPIQLLSGELDARAHSKAATAEIATEPARYLGELGPAAARVAEALTAARGETQQATASALDTVLAEKAQLEAVLRDLRECVAICNMKHEILLYNGEAQRLLSIAGEIGLGRSLFRLVTEEPIRHALERLQERFASPKARSRRDWQSLDVVCATRDGRMTLQGRISLILDPSGDRIDGFVATLRDATAMISDHAARDHLLKEMLEGLRRPAANLRAAVDILVGAPEMEAATRERFVAVIGQESASLARRIDELAGAYNELRIGGWSMNDVSSTELAACVRDRLAGSGGAALSHRGAPAWFHCDSFTVVDLLALLGRRLGERHGVSELRLAAEYGGVHVYLDLEWEGQPLPEAAAEEWLGEALTPSLAGLTGRDVLIHHRTEIWSEETLGGGARLRLPLPPAVEDHEAALATVLPERPEFYDFGLLARDVSDELSVRALSALTFVVFDTETTGLFPSAGDEIVQVGAVRVVNGRIIRGETFERLVDPGRRIPAAATRVHGITDEMVAGQPGPKEVLPAFHAYASDAVLVAHNAPFDMKFLQLKESVIGVKFDMAVLDTVLLSAHLFGQGAEHTLDALADRFGITFEEGQRHTALADALATAEVLCALIPVLEAKGVVTLADALKASDAAGAIRRRQARY